MSFITDLIKDKTSSNVPGIQNVSETWKYLMLGPYYYLLKQNDNNNN